jgi:hypothetical protein
MRAALVVLIGCGASQPPPPAPDYVAPVRPPPDKQQLANAHHALEDEQITAYQAGCDHPQTRCEPSCYVAALPDPRAGKKLAILTHWACGDVHAIVDELGDLPSPPPRLPRAKKPWETALGVRVIGGARQLIHPSTHERLTCVAVAAQGSSRALDACGGHGDIACEAIGNAAAHGVDVVHYRLVEARRLHAANNDIGCEKAATEAIAVARGMPRWRQYLTLNANKWQAFAHYRTRADGILDEDALFDRAASLAAEAATACGGQLAPKTTAAQEQSFHTCW